VNLTRGAGDSAQIRFRLVRLDRPARGGRGGGRGGFGGGRSGGGGNRGGYGGGRGRW